MVDARDMQREISNWVRGGWPCSLRNSCKEGDMQGDLGGARLGKEKQAIGPFGMKTAVGLQVAGPWPVRPGSAVLGHCCELVWPTV